MIAIGDELISGQRLDTNSQWLSQQLGNLGIDVRFHTSVGDDLEDHVAVIQQAISRVDILLLTGGLGPTADDLTRLAIARATNLELNVVESEIQRIEQIFSRSGRTMPPRNRLQAYFPTGAKIVPNPEGTAAGIDLMIRNEPNRKVRIIALPGVPAEMKQMWHQTVETELKRFTQSESFYFFHTLHCFGAGESSIEMMLPDLVQRGRDPKVGITASHATITLRVSTRDRTLGNCQQKIQPTLDTIRKCLGDLIFGENGETLGDVVARQLNEKNLSLAIADAGLNGEVERQLSNQPVSPSVLKGYKVLHGLDHNYPLPSIAQQIREQYEADFGLAIGWVDRDHESVANGKSCFSVAIVGPDTCDEQTHQYWGHSTWRDERAGKQVLNQFRLFLQRKT